MTTHTLNRRIAAFLVLACAVPAFGQSDITFSQRLGRLPRGIFQQTSVDTVFRAQSEPVPFPQDPGTPAGSSIVPDSTIQSNGYAPSPGVQTAPLMTQPTLPGIPQGGVSGDTTWNAFSPPITTDPFAPGGQPYAPYNPYGSSSPGYGTPYGAGTAQPFSTYGANGPAPFRRGWSNKLDLELIPRSGVAGAGNFEQFGVDYDLAFGGSFMPGWMLTWTNEFRFRNWEGPRGAPGMPGKAFRFGWDLELESAQRGPFNLKFGITPSINTDFDGSIGSTAFQLDGRGMMLMQMDQYWTAVLGAGFWDRVNDRIVPYAGLVYRDDFWEMRLTYPEAMISVFVGNEPQWAKWIYIRGEHHIEAYDVATAGGGNDEVELEDWRVLAGFRMDAGTYSWMIEAGWVFDRDIEFDAAANGQYNPSTGFITRIGWRY